MAGGGGWALILRKEQPCCAHTLIFMNLHESFSLGGNPTVTRNAMDLHLYVKQNNESQDRKKMTLETVDDREEGQGGEFAAPGLPCQFPGHGARGN
jgi:hypothetical protein